jgi:hypothetical protein
MRRREFIALLDGARRALNFGSAVSCLSSSLLPEGSRDRFPTFPVGAIS